MRRPFAIPLAAVAAASAGCGGGGGPTPPFQHFRSRPDLKPPPVRIFTPAHGTAPGYVLIAPKKNVVQAGPMIVDNHGRLVWFRPLNTRGVTDFRVQSYRGRPVLTWWRGRPIHGQGDGNYAIVDDTYRPVARVRPGNGLVGDIHEFMLTPRGSALMTIFHRVRRGSRLIFEGAVQEVDVATGRVLFEWHSLGHVALDESYERPPKKRSLPYDYFHVNSIDVDTDDNLLVSARNTHAVYKLDRRTGRIVWRLGGKRSDFAMGLGTRFAWQHDARRRPDGTITLFDNEAAPQAGPQSRGLVLRLDTRHMRATLVRELVHRPRLLAATQGNMQLLPNGHYFVGWGARPYFTEYDATGRRVLFDARFGYRADSYRAYRFPWTGHPGGRPAIALDGGAAYVSWNGATEVTRWQLLAGTDPDTLRPVASVAKEGFESKLAIPASAQHVAIRALARDGATLATSRTLELK
jgi:Arylsulfotransferase (ASST)